MSAAFNKIKKVDRSKLEGNALKAYDTLKEETDNFDKDVAVALNLDDDVERLAKKLEEKFPESVGKKKDFRPYTREQAKKRQKKEAAKKKAAKKKSTPKGSSGNKGSFAKLRASIAKRDGISYKAALPIAKKEYAEQKKKDSDSKKEKRSKRMEAFKRKYKGRGTRNTDVQKDSKIPAKAVGKRVSKSGNTYYEYRDNRTDQRQPQPTNEPRLDVGGMIKREYDVNINSGVGTYAKGGKIKDYQTSVEEYPSGFSVRVKFGKENKLLNDTFESKEKAISFAKRLAEKNNGSYEGFNQPIVNLKAKGGKTDETFIQDAVKEMEKKGTIGSFTKKAEKRGMTPIEFASEVLDSTNKNKFTEKTRKQAQFVKNANPELFAFGGEIVRDYDVNINSGVGTYAEGGKVYSETINDFFEEFSNAEKDNIKKAADYYSKDTDEVVKQLRPYIRVNRNRDGSVKRVRIDFYDESSDTRFKYSKKYGQGGELFDADTQVDYAQGGDILKAGDTDCPDELLNYAVGGRLNETMQGLKKGDTLKIKFGSAVSKDNVVTLRVKSRNKVRKGTIDKITFENLSNPKGVKFFAYDRGDGFSFAMGDLGISNIEILNKYKEGGKTQGYNAQLDESLGDRTGREELFEQKRKDRRDESKAMEEAMGRRAYASVRAMDKKKRRK